MGQSLTEMNLFIFLIPAATAARMVGTRVGTADLSGVALEESYEVNRLIETTPTATIAAAATAIAQLVGEVPAMDSDHGGGVRGERRADGEWREERGSAKEKLRLTGVTLTVRDRGSSIL